MKNYLVNLKYLSINIKYNKLSFVFPEEICHPISAIDYFTDFCKNNSFDYEVVKRKADWHGVQAGTAYLCISPDDLVKIIKNANFQNLNIGSDIGLIAYNNDPVLEIIKDGISSISVDFGLMGEKAAHFVTKKELIQEYLPTQLTLRGSV